MAEVRDYDDRAPTARLGCRNGLRDRHGPLTAGPGSTTLVVALYNSVFAAGIRANQSVDAMATIYTASMLVLLVVALRFVNPTQLVTRGKDDAGE